MVNKMKKIGIITYHSAYNFGSALQAYATQEVINNLGYTAEIINYRMLSQRDAYSLVRRQDGIRTMLKDASQFPAFNYKKERARRFELFFNEYLDLTDEFSDPKDFNNIAGKFNIIVSGSDQIWNKHSNELANVSWDYMKPYLLDGFSGKRISYASSIGNSTDQDLQHMKSSLLGFDHIAMREDSSARIIRRLTNKSIEVVIDPTLLLTEEDWVKRLNIKKHKHKPYILMYSLAGYKSIRKGKELIRSFADNGFQIKYITPYFYSPTFGRQYINCLSCGPIEFLDLLYNADIVVTDSFHGTMFSLNMRKKFFSLNGESKTDVRKIEVLKALDLMSRCITWNTKYDELDKEEIDYSLVKNKISSLREHSIDYLKNAIEN